MKLRLVILSAACLSCLVAPTEGTLLLTAAAVKGAATLLGLGGGALLGKGLSLAKGALAAKAALADKQPAIINSLAAGAAYRESEYLRAKSAALNDALRLKAAVSAPKHKPIIFTPPPKPCVQTPPPAPAPVPVTIIKPLPPSPIAAKISAFLNLMKSVIHAKSNAASGVISGIIKPHSTVYYASSSAPVNYEPLPPLQPTFDAQDIEYIEEYDDKKK